MLLHLSVSHFPGLKKGGKITYLYPKVVKIKENNAYRPIKQYLESESTS